VHLGGTPTSGPRQRRIRFVVDGIDGLASLEHAGVTLAGDDQPGLRHCHRRPVRQSHELIVD
jgi:hypothetical protein